MIREFFYLQKSDRKVILTLLCVIVIALGVIFFTGGEEETDGLMPVDTLRKERHRDQRDSATSHYQPKLQEGEHLVLNTADTTALMTVPGIGPYFARKVVGYGQRLGGYVSVDQLDEIEGFPLDAKAYFVIENACPEKLNINQLSLAALKRHPYINYFQAKAIMDYRRLHGPIRSLDDLRLSKDFPPEAIARLVPYVAY